MLALVGLGLWDENDISLKGLEAVKKAGIVYVELYTNIWHGSVENLEKLACKKIIVLGRKDVEDGFAKIVDEAKNKRVCLLVPGDPLAATTHADLVAQAKKAGIETRIIHASSIFTAVAESGLQLYKFGKTATIPLPEKTGGVSPESVYDAIKGNLSLGLHTLLLLDIDIENSRNLSVKEALSILEHIDRDKIFKDKKIVVMSRLGSGNQKIVCSEITKPVGTDYELPAIIIVPGRLHFAEEEILKNLSV